VAATGDDVSHPFKKTTGSSHGNGLVLSSPCTPSAPFAPLPHRIHSLPVVSHVHPSALLSPHFVLMGCAASAEERPPPEQRYPAEAPPPAAATVTAEIAPAAASAISALSTTAPPPAAVTSTAGDGFVPLPDEPGPHDAVTPPEYDAFISYRRVDAKAFARIMHTALEAKGFRVSQACACACSGK